MPRKKLTLSIEAGVIDRARSYSQAHRTTISRLVSQFLAELPTGQGQEHTPGVRRLLGILPDTASLDEYRRHLEEKHAD